MTLRTPDGVELPVRLRDGYWMRLLVAPYEPQVGDALKDVLSPGSVFVDCGANIGFWSAVVKRTLPAERVVAVEAGEAMAGWLRRTAAMNGGFEIVQAAVWRSSGEHLTFRTQPERTGAGSLVALPTGDEEVVETVTLADLVGDHEGRIVVKLDVEGAEISALEGMPSLFDGDRDAVLIYEDHWDDPLHHVTQHVLDMGAEVYTLDRQHRIVDPRQLDSIKADHGNGINFLAVPSGWMA